jgi:hypothetical protein
MSRLSDSIVMRQDAHGPDGASTGLKGGEAVRQADPSIWGPSLFSDRSARNSRHLSFDPVNCADAAAECLRRFEDTRAASPTTRGCGRNAPCTAGGTDGSQTRRWREMDSNLQYRAGSRLPLTGETLLPRPPGERQDRVAACEIFFAV